MSIEKTGVYPEPAEAFDWHHRDILDRPPYDHFEMVIALGEGRFVIEGRQSGMSDALAYAEEHGDEPDTWKALRFYEDQVELATSPLVF